MNISKCIKESFVVIEKEGSTNTGYEYIYAECENGDTFSEVINYMNENEISLVGAVHDFLYPQAAKFFQKGRLLPRLSKQSG